MKLISNTTSVKYRVTHEGSNGYFSPEGIAKKVVPMKDPDRFYEDCRVTMLDMESQKYIRGTVTGVDVDRIRIKWDDGKVCEYDLDENLESIRVL